MWISRVFLCLLLLLLLLLMLLIELPVLLIIAAVVNIPFAVAIVDVLASCRRCHICNEDYTVNRP